MDYHADDNYLFVNWKEIFKFKADNKNVNFSTQFFLGSIFNWFNATDPREVFLNRNQYDFSVDYNSINKSNMLNNHEYFITKNNIKKHSVLLNKCLLYYWVLVAL